MPAHGSHWTAIYGDDADIQAMIVRDVEDSKLIDTHPCVDVANKSDRAEEVSCLRWGNGPMVEDILVVTDSTKQDRFLFSGYPALRDGIRYSIVVDHVEPWEYGIEGWVHARVTGEDVSLAFFDTRYYANSTGLQPGQRVDVVLAGLAYTLEPLRQASIEIDTGPLYEMEKRRRLDEGISLAEAAKPVLLVLSGMAAFLPRSGEYCDDAEFGGVIEKVESFQHADKTIYRLEIVVIRHDDEDFRLPVFVSEAALDGYIPRLGEDVRGVMWVQGYLAGQFGSE